MSLVTTARLTLGHRRLLSESTSAVFPLPTGPATPTRKARFAVISEQEIPLRHRQYRGRLTCQQLAVRAHFICLRIYFQFRSGGIVHHVRFSDLTAVLHGIERLP